MKKLLLTIMCVVFLLSCVTACTTAKETKHEHEFSTEWEFDATNHWHSATCEHTDEKSGLDTHAWNEGETTKTATCKEDGEKTFTCTVCKATKKEKIDKLAHTPEEIAAIPATCTATGKTLGHKCSVCQELLDGCETTDKLAHTPEEIAAIPATCTATGKTLGHKCSVCQELLDGCAELPLDPNAHEYVWNKTNADKDVGVCKHNSEHTTEIIKLINQTPIEKLLWGSTWINPDLIDLTQIKNQLGVDNNAIAQCFIGDMTISKKKLGDGIDLTESKVETPTYDIKTRLDLHGYNYVIMRVAGLDGETHDFKLPVLLMTSEVRDAKTLYDAVYARTEDKYGCYYVKCEIDFRDYHVGQAIAGWSPANSEFAFCGTLIGKNGVQKIVSQNRFGGIFENLKNATIVDVAFENKNTLGSSNDLKPLIAQSITGTTFKNVTFKIIEVSQWYSTSLCNGGWLSLSINSSKFVNCEFANAVGTVTKLPVFFAGQNFENIVFENCTISGVTEVAAVAYVGGKTIAVTDVTGLSFVASSDVE